MLKLLRRVWNWLHHEKFAAELAEELEFHSDMKRRELGDDEPHAVAQAMGNQTLMREEARAVWIWPWLESIWQDLSYGIRSLRREPGFTLVAVGALASAIG